MGKTNPQMIDTGKDKFKAVWLSHSSIADFLKCPRLYYLRNVYKDPRTGHKFTIMTPPLALGQAVHEVVEGLSILNVEDRFAVSLLEKFETIRQIHCKRFFFIEITKKIFIFIFSSK